MEIKSIYREIHSFKRYNSVGVNMFTELCDHHHYAIPERFHHSKKKPLSINSHSSDRYIILAPILQMWKQAQSPGGSPRAPQ